MIIITLESLLATLSKRMLGNISGEIRAQLQSLGSNCINFALKVRPGSLALDIRASCLVDEKKAKVLYSNLTSCRRFLSVSWGCHRISSMSIRRLEDAESLVEGQEDTKVVIQRSKQCSHPKLAEKPTVKSEDDEDEAWKFKKQNVFLEVEDDRHKLAFQAELFDEPFQVERSGYRSWHLTRV